MQIFRTLFYGFFCIITFALLTPYEVNAAAYPQKNINFITPFGPGGASDIAGRALAQALEAYIDTPILVINKEGASGIIGSQWVRMQRKDGYNLLIARVGAQTIVPAFNPKTPYKWDQFTMLGLLQIDPIVLLVKAGSPYTNVSALMQAMRENPHKISYSTSGPFTVQALSPRILLKKANIDMKTVKMVPYKGGGAATTALLGGHVDFLCCNFGEAKSQIEAGTLIPLAITDTSGVPEFSHIPLFKDQGYAELDDMVGWTALYGPPNLPQDIVDYWAKILLQVSHDEQWKKMVALQGCIPRVLSPQATKEFVEKQFTLYNNLKKSISKTP